MNRIGLFLGASEPEKHPDAEFWAAFARLLLRAGYRPVLLGGKAEKALGHAVAGKLGSHKLNLCGNFTVSALARFIAELDLLVTPDTGPMHIAVWTGTPVLNLSLGPVNPWETGPFSPGHHVIRARMACVGCWRCEKPTVECKERMVAGRAGAVAEALLGGRPEGLKGLERMVEGLEVLRSGRDGLGLFSLGRVLPEPEEKPAAGSWEEEEAARLVLSRFWKFWFLYRFGRAGRELPVRHWVALTERHPAVGEALRASLARLALELTKGARSDASVLLADGEFWRTASPLLRPLSGYMHMDVQNRSADRASLLDAVSMVEDLSSF